jgi:chromosome segregation ATPase
VEILEKIEPLFSTLRRLRALIIDKNIAGFRGFMIDYINCDPSLYAALDLAGKNKLFSIIVDDLETAKKILELNASIKGGVINIFPLQQVEQMQVKQKEYPQ